jgi:hypothetical protein
MRNESGTVWGFLWSGGPEPAPFDRRLVGFRLAVAAFRPKIEGIRVASAAFSIQNPHERSGFEVS